MTKKTPRDILGYNRRAWDAQVDRKDRWTVPVSDEEIERARSGDFSIVLTPAKPVPRQWFGELQGSNLLCLAGAGLLLRAMYGDDWGETEDALSKHISTFIATLAFRPNSVDLPSI